MRLIKCYIENFGNLQNFSYNFKEGLNIIKKENGFGKTTFATFIKSMFYGLDISNKAENSDRKKYAPWQGGNFGGNIDFEINNKKYRIERFFGKKAADDTFKLFDLATNLESKDYTEKIGEEIFKINKEGYERSTYIPQGQIQIEMEDSINAKLGNVLESENDINSSDEALKKLVETMKVYIKNGNRGLINEKKEKLNELERKYENGKTDEINLETRKNILSELDKQIEENNRIKRTKQDLLSKKIEQGRKQAKLETYNNILVKVHENEEKYGRLQELLKNDAIDEFGQIEELEAKFEDSNITEKEIEDKMQNLEEQTKIKNKKSRVLGIIGVIIIILGIVLITLNISKIIGIIAVVLSLVIIIISILNMKNDDYAKQIIKLTNLKSELLNYKELKNKKQNYDLIKGQVELAKKELENAKELQKEFESSNNIEELKEKDMFADINESELSTEIKNLEYELVKLGDEKSQNKNQIEILENKIDENEYLENDIQILKEEIERLEEKYRIIEETRDLLLTAKQTFSSSYLNKMIGEFKYYLNLIDKTNLDTDVDINLDVQVNVNGSKKQIKSFSVGYKDLVYICIRFSLIKSLFNDELPFVILDDPFVNLDDEKMQSAIDLVKDFSKEYQVIYLLCNKSRM